MAEAYADEYRIVWIWALLSDALRTRWTLIVAQGKFDQPSSNPSKPANVRCHSPHRPHPLHYNVHLDLPPDLHAHLSSLRQLLHQLRRAGHSTIDLRLAV